MYVETIKEKDLKLAMTAIEQTEEDANQTVSEHCKHGLAQGGA